MISFKKFIYLKELFDNDLGSNDLNPIHASLPRTEVQMNNLDESSYEEMHELHEHLLNHYKPHELPKKDINVLKEYTGHGSEAINSELWENHQHNERWKNDKTFKKIDTDNPQIKKLDKIISDHKAPKTFHVYSSTRHDPEKLKNSEGIVHHPAFLSTSISKGVATSRDVNAKRESNGDEHLHVIHMDVPEGHPGIYVAHKSTSKYHGEKEFILPRGLNLRHIKTTTTKQKGYDSWNDRTNTVHTHLHQMEIVK